MARARLISKRLIWSAAATLSLSCASDSNNGSGPGGSTSTDSTTDGTTSVNPTGTTGSTNTGGTTTTSNNTGGATGAGMTGAGATGAGATGAGATGAGATGAGATGAGATGAGATGAGATGAGATGAGATGAGATGAGATGAGATGATGAGMTGDGTSTSDGTTGEDEPDAGTGGGDTDGTDDSSGTGDDTSGETDPGGDPGMSEGCGTEPTIPSSAYNTGQPISITAAGMERRYILRVPDNYDNTKPHKLIIAWHQWDGNDVQMYANDYYHLLPLSGGNAIFVAPNGTYFPGGGVCTGMGNGEGGCGWPNTNNSDLALGDAVVDELKSNFCIDNNRIFATGWSFGGSMSYKQACERALGETKDGVEGYIRGIAIYGANQLSGQCTPSTPVAFYGSHGTNDGVFEHPVGVGLAQNWANANGCNWETPPQANGNHVCTDIAGCPSDYPVQFCSFNGDHTPDPSDGGGGSWQYQRVWDFFNQF